MEGGTAAAAPSPAAAPAAGGRRVRSPRRLGSVSGMRGCPRQPSPVRRFWVRFLLPLSVGTRSRARRVSRDGVGV